MRKVTAKELTSNKTTEKAYRNWLKHDITQAILDIVDTESKQSLGCLPVATIREESASFMLGQQCGAQWAIERIQNLGVEYDGVTELVPDYGAREILKAQGIIKPTRKKQGEQNE